MPKLWHLVAFKKMFGSPFATREYYEAATDEQVDS